MDNTNFRPEPALRLKNLLKGAGLKSFRLDATGRGIACAGRSREWLVVAHLSPDWLNLFTFVCGVPDEPGLRVRLLETTMRANSALSLVKFGIGAAGVCLEIDYRAEHLDAAVVGNLVSLFYQTAEEQYPKVFRIVSGDETLRELEASLVTSEAA